MEWLRHGLWEDAISVFAKEFKMKDGTGSVYRDRLNMSCSIRPLDESAVCQSKVLAIGETARAIVI